MKRRYTLQSNSPTFPIGLWAAGGGVVLLLGAVIALIVCFPRILLWRSETLLTQATELAQSGDPLAAARRAEAAYRLAPENLDALRLAAINLAEIDPAAGQRLTFELAADPRATEADLMAALPAFSQLPVADFERLLLHFPETVRNAPEQLSRLSRGWAEAGNSEKAAAYARRYLELRSDPALALRLGTQLSTNPANETEAAKWLVQAIQTGDADQILPALDLLALLSPKAITPEQLNDFDAILQKLPGLSPEQIWKLRRFELTLHPNRQAEILSQLEPIQKKLPRPELAEWLGSLNETKRLIEWITPKEAIADPLLFNLYARALLKENQPAELIALLPTAPPIGPEITDPLLAWQRSQKQTAPLRKLAELLLARSPENPAYLTQVAYLRFLANQLDGPWMDQVAAILEKDPTNRPARTALALGQLKSKKPAEALRTLSSEPDSRIPLTDSDKIVLVSVWFAVGKKQEARAFLPVIRLKELLPEEENLLIKP